MCSQHNEPAFYRISEVSEILGISHKTLVRMCIDGRIPRRFTVTTYGGHWRIEKVYVDMIAAPKAA